MVGLFQSTQSTMKPAFHIIALLSLGNLQGNAGSLTPDHLVEDAAIRIRQAAGGSEVEIEASHENDQPVFEARWFKAGFRHELTISADGTVLSREEIIPIHSAPERVRDAVQAFSGHGVFQNMEKISKPAGVYYRANFSNESTRWEIRLNEKGDEIFRKTKPIAEDLQNQENPDGNCSFRR